MTPPEVQLLVNTVIDSIAAANIMMPLLKLVVSGIIGYIGITSIKRLASYIMFVISDLCVDTLVRETSPVKSEIGRIVKASPFGRIHIEFTMEDGSIETLKIPMGSFSTRDWRVVKPKN